MTTDRSSPSAPVNDDTGSAIAHGLVPMLVAAAGAIIAVGALAVVAALAAGEQALAGVLVGGLAVLGVLLFGVLTMALVVRVAPDMALLVAMTTYLLQVVVLLALYVRHERSEEMQEALASGWLAGGIAAATGAWVLGHLVGVHRAPDAPASWDSDVTGNAPLGTETKPGEQ